MLSFFPPGVLDEILNLIESVSEDFPSYSFNAGCPSNSDHSMARAHCACSRYGWGLFGHFFSHLSFLFSFSLSGRWSNID